MKRFFLAAVAAISLAGPVLAAEFSSADIEQAKVSVEKAYTDAGFSVEKVVFIKDTPTHLTGFVYYWKRGFKFEYSCDATMSMDNDSYVWRCWK
jgi:opacity protein-like surface antigen